MKAKPHALLLTPVLPLPGGSGRALRAWAWLQELTREYRVHLLVPGSQRDLPSVPPDYPAESIWALADAATATRGLRRVFGLLLPFLTLFSRRFVVDWQQPRRVALLAAVRSRLHDAPVRRIVVFRLYLHDIGQSLAERFPQAALDLDLDDLESRTRMSVSAACWRMRRVLRAASGLSTAIQYWFIERRLPRIYRHVYLAAPEDILHAPSRLAKVLACRPNRITIPATLAPPPVEGEIGLLFVGTLGYPPNEEAVRVLVDRLVPELAGRLERPWRLRIVGRHAPPELAKRLERIPRVDFLGDVDDIAGCYAAAHVVLVPLRAGGGTKLKTLEGFAHRRPVVSTPHGARGLAVVPGEHYLCARTAAEFAAAIVGLVKDRVMAERIATAGWLFCQRLNGSP